jgi:hypothetical protein
MTSRDQKGDCFGRDIDGYSQFDCHKFIHKDLIELGVDLGQQNASHDFERVFKTLADYKAVHGDLLVPQKFVVPLGDAAYSVNDLSMKLGANFSQIRVDGSYFEQSDSSEALGVNFEVKKIDVRGFDVIYSALEA